MTGPMAAPAFAPRAGAAVLADTGPDIMPVPSNGTGTPIDGDVILAGFAFAEATGAAPATVDLIDGNGAAGTFIARVNLLASESVRESLPYPGVHCRTGLFVNVVAGAVLGSVWVIDL